MKRYFVPFVLLLFMLPVVGSTQGKGFTRKDTLFGSNTGFRSWWDVKRYNIAITPDYNKKSIIGTCEILYTELVRPAKNKKATLQIDLQEPMIVDSIWQDRKIRNESGSHGPNWQAVTYKKEGNFYFINVGGAWAKEAALKISFHGKPTEAKMPPWDGGWVWAKDKKGRPWMSAACEGIGASVWYPCKDIWSDEPDSGASLSVTVDTSLKAIANGRLINSSTQNRWTTYTWEVNSPINPYNIIPYIGNYSNWSDTLQGEGGKLDLAYWVLDYALEQAKKQFTQVKPTIRALEHWFGPYPFYKDGYQLVQAPYLGMEHQSAVAYGNKFMNGYLGQDLSGSGWGLKWDYIIVHETGHEWFGNNLTAKDRADMWIQEGFTDYCETLFVEYYYGKEAGNAYVQGLRKNIENDKPVIGPYGVHREGSGDMYYKGANLLHTIRQIINNDERLRQILRGLNKDFYHQTVTTKQVEEYISKQCSKDLSKVFDQYLRTTKIPVLEYSIKGKGISYRWANCVEGFAMPVKIYLGREGNQPTWITPTSKWATLQLADCFTGKTFDVDKNFYIKIKKA